MSYSSEDRNAARKAFADSGLSYSDLTRVDLDHLRNVLGKHLKSAKTIKGYAMNRGIRMVNWPNGWAALTCKSSYFESREAVTFNPEGFVGFAGWADDTNVAPILAGFNEWRADVVMARSVARSLMLEAGAA